jgi:hypothetical protein
MEKEDMILINEFLHNEDVELLENEALKKLAEKIDLIVKQIHLQEQFNKDLQELRKQLDDLEESK